MGLANLWGGVAKKKKRIQNEDFLSSPLEDAKEGASAIVAGREFQVGIVLGGKKRKIEIISTVMKMFKL